MSYFWQHLTKLKLKTSILNLRAPRTLQFFKPLKQRNYESIKRKANKKVKDKKKRKLRRKLRRKLEQAKKVERKLKKLEKSKKKKKVRG